MSTTTLRPTTVQLSNLSNSNCPIPDPLSNDFKRLLVLMFIIIIIISFVGNACVLVVVYRNKRMHCTTNFLIVNMSVADLIITVLPMMWELLDITTFHGEWPAGVVLCKSVITSIYVSVAATIFSIVAVTIDRFLAIMFPFRKFIERRTLIIIIIIIWVSAISFASPALYAQNIWVDQNNGKKYCAEVWSSPFDQKHSPKHYTVVLFVGLYVIPVITIAVLYAILGRKIWKRKPPGYVTTQSEKLALQQKSKVIKMLICISLLFAVSWLPGFCVQFLYFFDSYYVNCFMSMPPWIPSMAFFLQYMNSAGNPVIYFTFSGAFRRGFRVAFGCLFPRKIGPMHRDTTLRTDENRNGIPLGSKRGEQKEMLKRQRTPSM